MSLPNGAQADPDHDGWYSWGEFPRGSFASRTGKLLFKPAGERRGLAMMFVDESHQNMGGSIHGGAVMSFIDMAMFAGGRCAGMAEGHYVTLDLHTRFINRGRIGVSLVAEVNLVRQTPGGLVFLAGTCTQDGEPCYDFTGTLKKITPRGKTAEGREIAGEDAGPSDAPRR